jgi:hypothetical protein
MTRNSSRKKPQALRPNMALGRPMLPNYGNAAEGAGMSGFSA